MYRCWECIGVIVVSLPCLSLRNMRCMRVQLWWGLLAPGHSQDGELPLWARSSLLSLTLLGEREIRVGGGGREGTPAEHKHIPLISVKG